MNPGRTCVECGTGLADSQSEPLCPACIFHRLANIGSTINPPETADRAGPSDEHDTDFYSEYELLGEIGRGGMGVIYKAHQASLNRIVALKVIHSADQSGPAARRRFQAEVEVAARLNHPNIVPIFDTGEMDGCPCFSMEFFPAGTLATRMNEFATRPEEGARLLVKVARAVSFAHRRGVLHRDLKPANILLDEAGEPHVGDFGLAKLLDSDGDLTRSGAVIGSPNYMSPEQAAGKSASLTVATDIYSLGVMLYQMLTGRTPFMADTVLETMRQVVEQEPRRPGTIVARVNRDLENICLKCLEKDPARRYRSAEELADDLERWLRHEPIQARPISDWERVCKWVRRHPTRAAMIALLAVVLGAGISGILWQWRKAEAARASETRQLRRAEAALARSALSLAEAALREGNGQGVQAALETVPVNLRDSTWTYLRGESDTSRALPPVGVEQMVDLAADPARPSVFAAADRAGRVVLFDVRDGTRLLEFVPVFPIARTNASLRLAFAKSGDRVAVGRTGPGGIVVYDANDGRKLAEWEAPPAGTLEFSPDGALLLQTSADRRRLDVWDATNGTRRWGHVDEYHAACFTADGRNIANYCWDEGLRLVDSQDGALVRRFRGNYLHRFAAQPGGDLLVAANPLGFVHGFDQADGRRHFEFQPHESVIGQVAFLPGGERFLTAATLPDGRQALQCWDSVSGRACQNLNGGSGEIGCFSLHPLSGELIVSGRETRVWETVSVPALRVLRGRNAHPSAVFWSRDDEIFAPLPDGRQSAVLQSFAGGTPEPLWSHPDHDYGQPSVSADGRRVAIGRYNSAAQIVVLERDGEKIKRVGSLNPRRMMAHLRLSPNGDRVAVVQSDFASFGIVDVATDKPAVTLEKSGMNRFSDVAWLDGGKHIVGLVTTHAPRSTPGSIEQIVLWDTATGRIVRSVTNATITSVACASPDGRRFAEAGADRNVRIRDGATLEVLGEFRVHNAPITALAWHPSRSILATASQDLVIRLWNLETGARLEELHGPLSPPSVLSFSPGGTRLATASRDGVARIWEPRSLTAPAPQP